jgi:hypothetical protein
MTKATLADPAPRSPAAFRCTERCPTTTGSADQTWPKVVARTRPHAAGVSAWQRPFHSPESRSSLGLHGALTTTSVRSCLTAGNEENTSVSLRLSRHDYHSVSGTQKTVRSAPSVEGIVRRVTLCRRRKDSRLEASVEANNPATYRPAGKEGNFRERRSESDFLTQTWSKPCRPMWARSSPKPCRVRPSASAPVLRAAARTKAELGNVRSVDGPRCTAGAPTSTVCGAKP